MAKQRKINRMLNSLTEIRIIVTDRDSNHCEDSFCGRAFFGCVPLPPSVGDIQGVSGGIVNILGGGSMDYSE
jgi:hypothetical protein